MSAKRLTDDVPLFICPSCLMAGYRFNQQGQAVNIRLAERSRARDTGTITFEPQFGHGWKGYEEG